MCYHRARRKKSMLGFELSVLDRWEVSGPGFLRLFQPFVGWKRSGTMDGKTRLNRMWVVTMMLVFGAGPTISIVNAQDGVPDLVVAAVDTGRVTVDCRDLFAEGTVAATVRNDGTAAAAPFEVLFFEDGNGNGIWDGDTVDRFLGQGSTVADLAVDASTQVEAAIDDTVAFAGNLIYAVADPEGLTGDLETANNTNHSGADCQYLPLPGAPNPIIEWSWTSSMVMPDHLNVMMTPGVIDLSGDGIPDVVFGATNETGGSLVVVGVLRALSGADGSELFTVTDPTLQITTASSVAVGDIDLDGLPEILACDSTGARLIAFENDGTFKWRSPVLETINWGAPALADIDGDGTPEIVIGRQVLSNAGVILWTGTGGRGSQANVGPLSLVADLDLDGVPEVVAGNTAYSAGGGIGWQQVAVPDGYDAVGNFDDDDNPEVVVVSGGSVWLLEHDGTVKWGPVAIPGGGRGGPPTVEDYDGDGEAEIGVAGATRYVVVETDGSVRWTTVTQDASSNVTGSSVFDFEGDGSAEVVYSDEHNLFIFNGFDGTVLFQAELSSCTWYEYPLVADVDADGNAELVAVANNNCGIGPQRGVYVFGDAAASWAATRRIWNQHTYHITNVNDDGSIPAAESPNWLQPGLNNFRSQRLADGNLLGAPDLTASLIDFDDGPCPDDVALTVRIGNGGANVAAAGVDVAFYDGDPAAGGTLLGVVQTTNDLDPGEYEDVELEIPPPFVGTVCVVADDDGAGNGRVNECDETNNSCCAEIAAECPVNRPPEVTCLEPDVCNDAGLCSASVACDGGVASCFDPDGDPTGLVCEPPGPFDVGVTAVSATCTDDSDASDSAECTVTVRDCEQPTCTPPAALVLECNTAGGVAGDDARIQAWLGSATAEDNCGEIASITHDAPPFFPLGSTTVTWTATDPAGNSSSCSADVVVADTTPPVITVEVDTCCLWTPNHKLTDVASYSVFDVCDPGAGASAVPAVTSDEATASELGAGGGNHCPDATVAAGVFSLRAERSGTKGADNGRVYDLAVTATDASGNVGSTVISESSCDGCPGAVCVPHDQDPRSSGKPKGHSTPGVCQAIDDGQLFDALTCN